MKTIKHYHTPSWKFTVAVLSFCIMQLISNGQSVQSQFWYTGDKIIDMSSYSAPTFSPTSLSPSKYVSNGAYWTNGSLSQTEFFVSDNTIYQYDNGQGSFVPQVMYDIVNTGPNETIVSSEIGIVPKPGSECDKYYIIYSVVRAQGNTNAGAYSHTGLYFVEYGTDLQNNGGILTPQTQLGTDSYLKTVGNCTDLFTASFAIGPRLANGERFLYAIMISPNSTCNSINTRLYKFRITSSGFVQEDLTPSIANDFIEFSGKINPSETELSPDRSYLAFARQDISSTNPPQTGLDLVVIKLDPATGNLLNSNIANVAYYDLPNEGMGIYSGLEFSSNSQNLFFNNRGLGIRSLTLATGSISSIVSGSNLYSNSHLEMRYYGSGSNDRRICAVKPPSLNSGNFEIGYINTNLNLMAQNSGLNNFIYSQFQTFQNLNGIYTLQDQVDGEDYATWSSPSNSVACCVRYFKGTFDSEAPFSVPTGTATWQPNFNPFNSAPSEVVLEKDLVIPSGAFITIKNNNQQIASGSFVKGN